VEYSSNNNKYANCKCGFDQEIFYKKLQEFEETRKKQVVEDITVKLDERDKRQTAILNKLLAKEDQREKEINSFKEDLNNLKNELRSYVKDAAVKVQQSETKLQEEVHKYQMLSFQYQHELQQPHKASAASASKPDPQVQEFMKSITQNISTLDDKVTKTTQEISQMMVSKEETTAKQVENLVTEVTTSKEARWKRIEGLTTKVFNLEEKFEGFQNAFKKGNEDVQSLHNDLASQLQTLIEIYADGKAIPNRPKRQLKKP